MKLSLHFRPLIALTAIVGSTAILLIAVAVASVFHGSQGFWLRVACVEVFSAAFWAAGAVFLRPAFQPPVNSTGYGGIAPSIALVLAVYGALSIVVLLVDWAFLPRSGPSPLFWAVQILRTLCTGLVIVALEVARMGAVTGLPKAKVGYSPNALAELVRSHERRLRLAGQADASAALKKLRESIASSLNDNAALSTSDAYRQVSEEILSLCGRLEGEAPVKVDVTDRVARLISNIRHLSAMATRRT